MKASKYTLSWNYYFKVLRIWIVLSKLSRITFWKKEILDFLETLWMQPLYDGKRQQKLTFTRLEIISFLSPDEGQNYRHIVFEAIGFWTMQNLKLSFYRCLVSSAFSAIKFDWECIISHLSDTSSEIMFRKGNERKKKTLKVLYIIRFILIICKVLYKKE